MIITETSHLSLLKFDFDIASTLKKTLFVLTDLKILELAWDIIKLYTID